MDTENFLKTEYAKQLIKDAEIFKKEIEEFNKQWHEFWQADTDWLSTILICHLSVEHYVEEYLESANPAIGSIKNKRLTFSTKLDLMGERNKVIQMLMPGLKRLNRIRNRLVHNMGEKITDEDLLPIKNVVWPWHKAGDNPCNEGIELIKDFSLMATAFINSHSNGIRRYGEGMGYIAYERWLSDKMSNICDAIGTTTELEQTK